MNFHRLSVGTPCISTGKSTQSAFRSFRDQGERFGHALELTEPQPLARPRLHGAHEAHATSENPLVVLRQALQELFEE